MGTAVTLYLYLLSGVCAYAAAVHLIAALQGPANRVHLAFTGMCLSNIPYVLSFDRTYHSADTQTFVSLLKWNISLGFLWLAFFLWFITLYVQVRRPTALWLFGAFLAILFVANLVLPYSVQYAELDGLQTLLTQGQEIWTYGVGSPGAWSYVAAAGICAFIVYALIAFAHHYRVHRSRATLAMLLAVVLFAANNFYGIGVRLDLISFSPVAPLGLFAVVIVMSATHVLTENERRKEVLQELQNRDEALRIAAIAFESQEGMMVCDTGLAILRTNSALSRITGYAAKELAGRRPDLLHSERHPRAFYDALWLQVRSAGSWTGEVWCRDKVDRVFPAWINVSTVRNAQGVPTHYVVSLTDITDRKRAEEEIKRLAYYDSLTDLPNRQLLMDRLSHVLRTRATVKRHGAMLFIDLDHFKNINDTLGHAQGDRLLTEMAQRLRTNVRESDTVSRFGGDEFVLLLDWLGESSEQAAIAAKKIADKLLKVIARPYQLGERRQSFSASIGVALWQCGQKTDAHELLKQADLAMYEAKKAGRNSVCFFDPAMQVVLEHRTLVDAQLRQALERREFTVYYQPRVDHRGALLGAEALLRWLHPERGIIPPADFIAAAEESGLIVPLGWWVLEAACVQLAQWSREDATRGLHLSVNISPRQFSEDSFESDLADLFVKTGADPARLELEITENLLLRDMERIIEKMQALRLRGVRFALDDFGTGYSSLSYLHRLPISIVKIDRAFVRDMPVSRSSDAIVHTIVQMGQRMGMEVVAEGVETEEQKAILLQRGCLRYQGFLFGRPAPIDIFEREHVVPARAPSLPLDVPLLWQV